MGSFGHDRVVGAVWRAAAPKGYVIFLRTTAVILDFLIVAVSVDKWLYR